MYGGVTGEAGDRPPMSIRFGRTQRRRAADAPASDQPADPPGWSSDSSTGGFRLLASATNARKNRITLLVPERQTK
jgi:hypothetical protein